MKEILQSIAHDMFYYTGTAIVISVLFMYMYIFIRRFGVRKTILMWLRKIRYDKNFRRMLLVAFYAAMIIAKTLLYRKIWFDPANKIFDGWRLHNDKGELETQGIENMLLFIPLIFLYLWAIEERIKDKKWIVIVGTSIKYSFLISLGIELCQLVCHLGTFQISDLVYNTAGGVCGSLLYCIFGLTCSKLKQDNDMDEFNRNEEI